MNIRYFVVLGVIAATTGLWSGCTRRPVEFAARVVAAYPHDPTAYTQGLFLEHGRLFESTGLYGQSTVREVELATGNVIRQVKLPDRVFGEGLTLLNGTLWVLTWKEGTVFLVDPATFEITGTRELRGEGWGLTSDGKWLIMSDGTSTLKWIDPATFETIRSMPVTESGKPVINLNELEYVDGHIYANIFMQDRIVKIEAKRGRVIGSLELSALRQQLPTPHQAEVLNGLAWNERNGTWLFTGKNWPTLFEVKIND